MRDLDERWNISIEPLQAWGAVDKTAGISPLLICTYQTYLSSSAYESMTTNEGINMAIETRKLWLNASLKKGSNNENPILLKVMPTNTHTHTHTHNVMPHSSWQNSLENHIAVCFKVWSRRPKNQHLPVTCTNLWPLRVRTTEIHLDDLWAPLPGD